MIQQIYACTQCESEYHSVTELCDVYEVSRSGYYKWLKRKGTLNRYEQQQQELDHYVADVHSHYPSQGYRGIADTLLNPYGWLASDVSALKSIQRLGIKGFVRKQKSPTPIGAEHNRFPNVLNRNFRQYWKCDDIHKEVADTIHYFNYIRPIRKFKRKPPVQYRLELAA